MATPLTPEDSQSGCSALDNDGLSLLPLLDALVDEVEVNEHEIVTAPLLTHDAAVAIDSSCMKQYAVLGQVLEVCGKGLKETPMDRRLYCNTNAPFSAVICGVQGSGKSHTLSILLESMLIPDARLGRLPSPLSALVLHFGEGGIASKPCEAVYVSQNALGATTLKMPPTTVFCAPSAMRIMTQVYAGFTNVQVYPLYFMEEDVDAQSLLSLMAVNENGQIPLYIQVVMKILQDLGDDYSYSKFKTELKFVQFTPVQKRPLEMRLGLLDSFLCHRNSFGHLVSAKTHKPVKMPAEGKFVAGGLTIVDLTDPFINEGSACSLFEIVLKLFNKAEMDTGKVVVLDEAHKYLSEDGGSEGSKRLTSRLLSFTRQMRHLSMRVIISTQEPTVVPSRLLDLCSFIICHRFQSSGWWAHLAKHIGTESTAEVFNKVIKLKTGQALIFSNAALALKSPSPARHTELSEDPPAEQPKATVPGRADKLGAGYVRMKTRQRVTDDGGRSVLACRE